MELLERNQGEIVIVALKGRLDSSSAPQLGKSVEKVLLASHPKLAVDMSGVTFIDSSGLSALVQVMKRCRERQGAMVIFGLQQTVRMIFELTRLDKAFDLFPSEKEALKFFPAA